MTIMEALDLLDQIIDESDPDVSISLTSNHYMKYDQEFITVTRCKFT